MQTHHFTPLHVARRFMLHACKPLRLLLCLSISMHVCKQAATRLARPCQEPGLTQVLLYGSGLVPPAHFEHCHQAGYCAAPPPQLPGRSTSATAKKAPKAPGKASSCSGGPGAAAGAGVLSKKSYPAGADAPTRKQSAVESCGGAQHSGTRSDKSSADDLHAACVHFRLFSSIVSDTSAVQA